MCPPKKASHVITLHSSQGQKMYAAEPLYAVLTTRYEFNMWDFLHTLPHRPGPDTYEVKITYFRWDMPKGCPEPTVAIHSDQLHSLYVVQKGSGRPIGLAGAYDAHDVDLTSGERMKTTRYAISAADEQSQLCSIKRDAFFDVHLTTARGTQDDITYLDKDASPQGMGDYTIQLRITPVGE